jgi:hypothetical protein
MDEGRLVYSYTLGRESFVGHREYHNGKLTGRGIKGKVIATQGGTVKLHLGIDETQEIESAHPYRWAPPTGNFMYLMPKLGSEAILYFPDPGEENAKAINCVRTEASKESRGMANPSLRGLHTEHGKRFLLYPDVFGFESDTGGGPLRFVAKDDEGIAMETAHGITMLAGGSIRIEAPVIDVKSPERVSLYRAAGFEEGVPEGAVETRAGRTDVFSDGGRCAFTGTDATAYVTPKPAEKPFDVGKLIGNIFGGLAVVGAALLVAAAFSVAAPLLVMGAIGGALAVGFMAASDATRGEVSDAGAYMREGLFGTVEGIVTGAAGLAFKGVKAATRAGRLMLAAGREAAQGAVWSGSDNLLRAGLTEEEFDAGEFGNSLLRGSVSGVIGGGTGRLPGLDALSKAIFKTNSPALNARLAAGFRVAAGAAAGVGANYGAQLAEMALFDEEGRFDPDLGRADAESVDLLQVGISATMGAFAARANVNPNKPVSPIDDRSRARVTKNTADADDANISGNDKKTAYGELKQTAQFLKYKGLNATRRREVIKAFNPGIEIIKLDKDLTVYRYSGGIANPRGRWVTTGLLSDPVNQLALPPGSTAENITQWIIPKNTEVLNGTAAPNFGRIGKAVQIYVPDSSVLK